MTLTGKRLIGQQAVAGSGTAIHAIDPSTGQALAPACRSGMGDRVAQDNPLGLRRLLDGRREA